jgi:hypothetical protein
MPYYQKESTYSNAIPIKTPITFFRDIEKAIVKYVWKHTRSQITKVILKKKFNIGNITALDFKLYYRAITTKKPSVVLAQKQMGRRKDPNRRSKHKPMSL